LPHWPCPEEGDNPRQPLDRNQIFKLRKNPALTAGFLLDHQYNFIVIICLFEQQAIYVV